MVRRQKLTILQLNTLIIKVWLQLGTLMSVSNPAGTLFLLRPSQSRAIRRPASALRRNRTPAAGGPLAKSIEDIGRFKALAFRPERLSWSNDRYRG
jgi:hypothetical protein